MADKTEFASEVVGAAIAQKVTNAGAAVGIAGVFSSFNWIGLGGLLIAAAGYLTTFYFQQRKDRREQVESAARIAALRDQCGLDKR